MEHSGLILIPAHNEEESIAQVIQGIRRYVPDIPIIVINSASTDRTAMIAQDNSAVVIDAPKGYWPALCTGYRYALTQNIEWIVQLDADGQHPPQAIPKLLACKGQADWIVGSRWNTGAPISISRWLAQKILQQWVYHLCANHFTDISSGFWLLNSQAISTFLQYSGQTGDAAIRLYASRSHLRMMEVPVTMTQRKTGQSMHSGLSSIHYLFKVGKDLMDVKKSTMSKSGEQHR